jgi:2-dehydro-3-deoxy-D-arabinonate dehydratase
LRFGLVDVEGDRRFALFDGTDALVDSGSQSLPAGMAEALEASASELRTRLEHARASELERVPAGGFSLLAPVDPGHEVWAAGVTYTRSLEARTSESRQRSVYDLVYEADRPELFLKATGRRVVAPGTAIGIRADSSWNVPEPELTLVVNRHAEIVGYTIGDDVSSRSIEGENPLYLPQAKLYDRSCAIGPAVVPVWDIDRPAGLVIEVEILRKSTAVFRGETAISAMRRSLEDLVVHLFRALEFPGGVLLLTGTGIVPPDELTLEAGDEVRIRCEPIGELVNVVQRVGTA